MPGGDVAVDLKAIEQLATDQSSLKAAAGLAKPGKWSGIGASHDGVLIWGECAGSGANPYRVMADLRDLGNKCTCPSRKFPCKHVLGLLWVNAEAIVPFDAADTPDWVGDWLGRRRGAAAPKASTGAPAVAKDALAAQHADPEPPASDDPKAIARREAAAAKRSEDTERAILDALDALEQWIGDQLRMGLSAFIDDATARCRRIGARLVDGKAAVLAGRIDELPARLLALPAGDRPRGAVVELGKLVLLARAFRAAPRDADIRRAVAHPNRVRPCWAIPKRCGSMRAGRSLPNRCNPPRRIGVADHMAAQSRRCRTALRDAARLFSGEPWPARIGLHAGRAIRR